MWALIGSGGLPGNELSFFRVHTVGIFPLVWVLNSRVRSRLGEEPTRSCKTEIVPSFRSKVAEETVA